MYTKLLTEVTSGRGVGEYVCISVHVCVQVNRGTMSQK